MQALQLPAQPGWLAGAASRRNAYFALCNEPVANVPRAPRMQTIMTTRAVCGDAAIATTPPAPSITAAANCVGAIERNANCMASVAGVWDSDQIPNAADAMAAHTHTTPAISMC